MQLLRWGFLAGSQSIGLHFDPVPQGMVQTSLSVHNELDDETKAGIGIPTRYIRVGNTDEPRDNGLFSIAWDNNLSGADIMIAGIDAGVQGTWMLFG